MIIFCLQACLPGRNGILPLNVIKEQMGLHSRSAFPPIAAKLFIIETLNISLKLMNCYKPALLRTGLCQ